MAEDNRFWNLMAKTKLWQELDGKKCDLFHIFT
jgi:hypothetical protein